MTRKEKKKLARERFDRQIKKERVIGIDPIFEHRCLYKYGYPNIIEIRKEWKKKLEEYEHTQVS